MKIRFARGAIADLDEIWIYMARDRSVDSAERLLRAISDRFKIITSRALIYYQEFAVTWSRRIASITGLRLRA
jgi:plasmid stabilization system protein ParE